MPIVVEAQQRSRLGKNACRRLRAEGMIPAVLYGPDIESQPIAVNPKEIINILRSDSGRNTILQLSLKDASRNVMIRDYQLDPIRDSLIHTDFQTIAMDKKMEFEVPVEVVGTAKGVREGGVLELILREITVECLPGDVPDSIEVDVSHLDINDPLHVSDLQVDPEKVEILNDPEVVVLLVAPPTVVHEEEEVVEEAAEEGAEPEVIGKGKEEAKEEEED